MNVKSLAGDACEHFSTILTHAKYSHGFVMLFEAGAEKWDCIWVLAICQETLSHIPYPCQTSNVTTLVIVMWRVK